MTLKDGGQLLVEHDRLAQRIEERFCIARLQAHDLMLVNGLLGMCQCAVQDELADGLALEARGAFQDFLSAVLQAEVDPLLLGV